MENISNIPVCISQTRQLKAAISACFIVTVCTCRRETLVTLEMPLNGREIWTERGRGATGERGTCWADGSSVIPTWGPTGTNWNAVGHGAHCLSSFVVLSVRKDCLASYCLCCREIEGAFNKSAWWAIRSLELQRSWGDFTRHHPLETVLWLLHVTASLFICWLLRVHTRACPTLEASSAAASGSSLRCVCEFSFCLWLRGSTVETRKVAPDGKQRNGHTRTPETDPEPLNFWMGRAERLKGH